MNELLQSVKADLLDRRLLPIVALVLVALAAAIGYVVLGGSSSKEPTEAGSAPIAAATPPGIPVAQAQNATRAAVAETTSGEAVQRHGHARDPFTPLPGQIQPKTKASSSAATSTSTSSSTPSKGSGGTSTGSKGGGEETSKPSKPSTPAKPKTLYKVSLQFGVLPAGVTPANAQLAAYDDLVKPTPFPSAQQKLIELVGVTVSKTSKSAVFAVSGEVILHGEGTCLPSAANCKAVQVAVGKSEQLESVTATGQPLTYELRVVGIEPVTASAASVKDVVRSEAALAKQLLGPGGTLAAAGLRFSSKPGLLVSSTRRSSHARSHAQG